ncbi:MAG: flippase-like domain-containing protein [Sphingobacteriales bacterium]|nr:MAG: flippase-like domain-containing protein [Sphingobacteriales bacterium]
MKRHIAKFIKPLFFLGIGLLLVWWSLSGFDADARSKIADSLQGANYFWVILSLLFALVSHVSRAIRWQMLMEGAAAKPSFINTLLALGVSYLANLAVPRMGEITRCGIISRYEPVPPEKAFGTVITERAIDVATLFLLTFLVVLTQFKVIGKYFEENVSMPLMAKFSGLFLGHAWSTYFFLVLLLLLLSAGILYLLVKFRQTVVFKKIKSLAKGIGEGVTSVRHVKNLPLLIAHSVFIWFMYFAMIYICFFALTGTSELGPQAGLAVMVMGSFGIIATQGGIGAYQIIVSGVLVLYGVDYMLAYAFSWLAWGAQTLLVIFGGFLAMVALPWVNRKIKLNEKLN